MKELKRIATSSDSATLLPRRQFIVLGSAAVAGLATANISAGIRRAAGLRPELPRLSVGFIDATTEALADPAFSTRVIDASQLQTSLGAFRSGVQLKVLGGVPAGNGERQAMTMGLDAMYRVEGREEKTPFMAWTHASASGASASAPFLVPMDDRQPLSLMISSGGAGRAPLREIVNLDPRGGRNDYKLRRGVYFVAVHPAGGSAPDWSSIQASGAEVGQVPVLRSRGLATVTFDYVAFTVA
jgi:hypothetical protein